MALADSLKKLMDFGPTEYQRDYQLRALGEDEDCGPGPSTPPSGGATKKRADNSTKSDLQAAIKAAKKGQSTMEYR